MDKKPSLSQYFGEADPPPAAQFFDEIGTASKDMVQSIYLGDGESKETTTPTIFQQDISILSQQEIVPDLTFSTVLPTVGSGVITASDLPDPSTFFDNIGEPTLSVGVKSVQGTDALSVAMEELSIKQPEKQVDIQADRRRDAWIPNEEAQKTLIKAQSSPQGSFFPEREVLTMPGLILEEELVDSVQACAASLLGVGAWGGGGGAGLREHAARDEAGLLLLLRAGRLRAALNATATLIDAAAQGLGRVNRPTKHTPRTLQLWLTRFAIMARIKMYDIMTKEAAAFGDLSKPDMYYQFYPEQYGSRSGSLVPFSLRLLLAELAGAAGAPEDAMGRLYAMLHVIRQMLSNLRAGKTEDGTAVITSEQDKEDSIRLWSGREIRVRHSIVNCAIILKDYRLAINQLSKLSTPDTTIGLRRAVSSALCRLSLQAGHIKAAYKYLEEAREMRQDICPLPDVREYVDCGLAEVAQGKYQDAYNYFARAADQEPTNIMVANNLAVCLLYMGRLKDAIAVLQKALNSDPERGLHESLLINLCTLYELESSNPREKKLNLLRMLCKYKSDKLPNVVECLKLNA